MYTEHTNASTSGPFPPNFSPLHGLSMYTLRAVAPSLEPATFACFLLADISLGTLSGIASETYV